MDKTHSRFPSALMQELMASMNNLYGADNWDAGRFGAYQTSLKRTLVSKLNKLLSGKLAIVTPDVSQIQSVSRIERSLDQLAANYELLADDSSRSTMIKVLAYRLLGPQKVKLPLNTTAYWQGRKHLRSLIKGREAIQIKFPSLALKRMTLAEIGYPIELFFAPMFAMATFVLKQYEYGKRVPAIRAEAGDYVIDAGGGWGDTALYFAHRVGSEGKVFSFEFAPENLEIMRRNLNLNPALASRTEVISKALWTTSGEIVSYRANGPSTSLNPERSPKFNDHSAQVPTISIDDFVAERQLSRVDFIKMDIEGAELSALKGAERTVRAFKPKLAISLYHRDNDFTEIPDHLNKLGLGYQFFLDHFTVHGEETILFAAPAVR
jgi:FkbM family methyltransferase